MRGMGERHILIEKAFIYSEPKAPLVPKKCRYDFLKGGWMISENNEEVFLVTSTNPNKPLAGTKKADIETGEDQKSE